MNYDTHDMQFTPNTGVETEISIGRNDAAIGSDFNYNSFKGFLHNWWNPSKKWVPGLRLDAKNVNVLVFTGWLGLIKVRQSGDA